MNNPAIQVIAKLKPQLDETELKALEKKLTARGVSLRLSFDQTMTKKECRAAANALKSELEQLDPSFQHLNLKKLETTIRQVAAEQKNWNALQRKSSLDQQQASYQSILKNMKEMYALRTRLLTAGSKETAEIEKQLKALHQQNQNQSILLNQQGLKDDSWEQKVNQSHVLLENQLKINEAKEQESTPSKFQEILDALQTSGAFQNSVLFFRQIIDTVHELDDALSSINHTMNTNSAQLSHIGKSSLDMAAALGTSANNVLSTVSYYAAAGQSANQLLKKAKPAVMVSNVTGMAGKDSAAMLNTVMNQFDLTQQDLMTIADTLEMVSQSIAYDFSSGIQEIISGIEHSGDAAHNAGLNLQEYTAMLGLAIEKTGQSGDEVGNAYQTIFQRISQASSFEGILTEDTLAAERSLNAVGIVMRENGNEFRNVSDILSDLSSVWEELSSEEQKKISIQIAGVEQSDLLSSLMENWNQYRALVEKASNASGTAFSNQGKYASSLSGKLQTLSAIWESISNQSINSSTLNWFADMGIELSKLMKTIGLFKTAAFGLGAVLGAKNLGYANTISVSAQTVQGSIHNSCQGENPRVKHKELCKQEYAKPERHSLQGNFSICLQRKLCW